MKKFLTLFTLLLFTGVYVFAQNKVISGKVTDETGKSLSDVSVQVKGTKIGTITNSEGNFTLSSSIFCKNIIVFFSRYGSL